MLAEIRGSKGKASDCLMMTAEEKLTLEDVRYLKVAIALALGSPDIVDMPTTKLALNELYDKLDRIYKTEANNEE